MLVIGYHTGMRRGEITMLRWDQVDFDAGVIRLEKKQTKTKRERLAPIYGEMRGHLEMAKADRDVNHARCPYIIAENGVRVADIKTAWNAAVRRAGIPKVLVHDLRRTAASNMDQAGIPRRIIMDICGWKSEAMFFRYRIGTEKQVVQAGQTMETWLAQKPGTQTAKKPADTGQVQ